MTIFAKTIQGLLLAGAVSISAQAGDERHFKGKHFRDASPEQRAEMMTERMTKKLGLTETQSVQIGEINQRYAQEISTLRDLEREQRHAEMEGIQVRRQQEIAGLLDDDQQAELEEMTNRIRERHAKRAGHRDDDDAGLN